MSEDAVKATLRERTSLESPNPYAFYVRELGLTAAISKLLEDQKTKWGRLRNYSFDMFMTGAQLVLASIDAEIFQAILNGNLTRKMYQESAFYDKAS